MTASLSVPAVSVAEVRAYISNAKELQKGIEIFDARGIERPARYQNKLFAEVKGSEGQLYKVALTFTDIPRSIAASCTCPAAESRPICKHATALLIAWARAPESFAVSEAPPKVGPAKIKAGQTSAEDLMKSGIEQVITLVRELGTAGVAAVGKDRVDQIRMLGESLRENRLPRISADVFELASMLGGAGGAASAVDSGAGARAAIPSCRYTDVFADVLLTAKKLEKHLAMGQPLEERYVEELVGKTWKPSELKPITGLRLVEIAYAARETSDGFLVRESRFVDLKSGAHFSERQIVSLTDKQRHPWKRSYAASVLEGVSGSVYPGFPPRRITLDHIREELSVSAGAFEALIDLALPDVGSALAALQAHRKDVFAPDLLPVSVRVDTLFARGARIEAVDALGHALHLPDDPALEERLADALRDGRLRALIGDVGIEAALPVIHPLAAVLEGPFGAELRTLDEPGAPKRVRKDGPRLQAPRETSSWATVARVAGVSEAPIILGELREELADRLVAGLGGLGLKAMGSVSALLSGLELPQLAALADSAASRTEPTGRLNEFIKLYRGVGLALVRLAGATHVERDTLEQVPTYESVFVRRPSATLAPPEVRRLSAEGALNRYEAAVHYARYYEELPPEELSLHIYTTWADGSTGPYVARAFAGRGPEAVAAATRALDSPSGRVAKMTAVRVLQAAGGPRAEEVLHKVSEMDPDVTLRVLALDALDAIDLQKGQKEAVQRRRASIDENLARQIKSLLTESRQEDRCKAVEALVELGHRNALPVLRRVYADEKTLKVREAAAYALARLGDTEMAGAFLKLLAMRGEPEHREEIEVAIRALGRLGDVRGLPELLSAYAEGYNVATVADAIKGFGAAAMDPLIDLIESRPELIRRQAAINILEHMPADELGASLARRVSKLPASPEAGSLTAEALAERAHLLLKIADAQAKSRRIVAKALCDHIGASEEALVKNVVKIAERALGVR
jgi:HEAT repeat protein